MVISWDFILFYMVLCGFIWFFYGILSDSIGMFDGISWDFREIYGYI